MCDSAHIGAGSAGKGTVSFLFSLAVLVVGVFVGIKVIPLYYAASNFETDVKTEVSRAGARFYDDSVVLNDIIDLAKKNEVILRPEDITLLRAGGQIHVNIQWTVPVDFVFFDHTFLFTVQTSSYIGRL